MVPSGGDLDYLMPFLEDYPTSFGFMTALLISFHAEFLDLAQKWYWVTSILGFTIGLIINAFLPSSKELGRVIFVMAIGVALLQPIEVDSNDFMEATAVQRVPSFDQSLRRQTVEVSFVLWQLHQVTTVIDESLLGIVRKSRDLVSDGGSFRYFNTALGNIPEVVLQYEPMVRMYRSYRQTCGGVRNTFNSRAGEPFTPTQRRLVGLNNPSGSLGSFLVDFRAKGGGVDLVTTNNRERSYVNRTRRAVKRLYTYAPSSWRGMSPNGEGWRVPNAAKIAEALDGTMPDGFAYDGGSSPSYLSYSEFPYRMMLHERIGPDRVLENPGGEYLHPVNCGEFYFIVSTTFYQFHQLISDSMKELQRRKRAATNLSTTPSDDRFHGAMARASLDVVMRVLDDQRKASPGSSGYEAAESTDTALPETGDISSHLQGFWDWYKSIEIQYAVPILIATLAILYAATFGLIPLAILFAPISGEGTRISFMIRLLIFFKAAAFLVTLIVSIGSAINSFFIGLASQNTLTMAEGGSYLAPLILSSQVGIFALAAGGAVAIAWMLVFAESSPLRSLNFKHFGLRQLATTAAVMMSAYSAAKGGVSNLASKTSSGASDAATGPISASGAKGPKRERERHGS